MGYRTGFTLLKLLQETRELASTAEVRDHIDKAINFITDETGSSGRRYQRGKHLVNHLLNASRAASSREHGNISGRLTDFAEYAAGEIPLALLETRYVPERRQSEEKFTRMLLEVGLRRSSELLTEFLKDQPDASARDAQQWLSKVANMMERWSVGEDSHGGVKIRWQERHYLTWFRRVQLVLNEPEDQSNFLDLAEEIADIPGAELIATAVQRRRRRAALDQLRTVVEDPEASESDIHKELQQQSWIFGGRYVKELSRRRLTTVDEIDIPLLRGDGSLHVVELKRAKVPHLVERIRSHCAVGADVHRAVSQAANYLRSLDEHRPAILTDHGIECRRTFATVLIGHPKFVNPEYRADEIADALRTYNAALNRVEVITYQELIDAAERTLALDEDVT
ncbi:Shedu anti-phage system protein SduA domain-containing protein [Streptoalloteichus hindustanus]|uniref:Shedu protein SduA C-terminal domain-containing protein n=1 Tax=Streptoalloteichus hindustanus TaxID=2017 RepID=A0A1M5NN16_STRHI|nr:Shedu anti-phage system protein SduA domain-containing protein [Streptoalloteichus hindustanus]SHG90845.1 protein of unknown function [Streptoalloteichus hindustanus]